MTVTVYSTPMCRYCQLLKMFLKENKISFEEIDLSHDREKASQIIERTGQRTVPVTEINGQLVVGFDREKISALLEL